MSLENLARIGKLKAHAADRVEINRLLASAERALKDAAVAALSSDTRLRTAYGALVQAASQQEIRALTPILATR